MDNVRAVFLSEWLANPYKRLLAKHLETLGVKVDEYRWSLIFCHKVVNFGENTKIIHLHTLDRFLLGRNSFFRWLKLFIFISQILLLRLLGIKTVWTVHEWANKFRGGQQTLSPNQAVLIGKIFHAIIAHCDTTKDEVKQFFNLEESQKVVTIPHGNYIDCYENKVSPIEARESLDIPENSLVFLLFGGIYHYKGFVEAIDAFKDLSEDNLFLLVVGNPKEEGLEEQIKAKIKGQENILFVPERVPDEKVQIYFNACDIVVAPYKIFTTSGVAILAMSFGKVCIAPDADYFQDILDDKGAFLYSLDSQNGLLQGLQLAIEHRDDILAMGKHNLSLAKQWNWDFVAKETYQVYFSPS